MNVTDVKFSVFFSSIEVLFGSVFSSQSSVGVWLLFFFFFDKKKEVAKIMHSRKTIKAESKMFSHQNNKMN